MANNIPAWRRNLDGPFSGFSPSTAPSQSSTNSSTDQGKKPSNIDKSEPPRHPVEQQAKMKMSNVMGGDQSSQSNDVHRINAPIPNETKGNTRPSFSSQFSGFAPPSSISGPPLPERPHQLQNQSKKDNEQNIIQSSTQPQFGQYNQHHGQNQNQYQDQHFPHQQYHQPHQNHNNYHSQQQQQQQQYQSISSPVPPHTSITPNIANIPLQPQHQDIILMPMPSIGSYGYHSTFTPSYPLQPIYEPAPTERVDFPIPFSPPLNSKAQFQSSPSFPPQTSSQWEDSIPKPSSIHSVPERPISIASLEDRPASLHTLDSQQEPAFIANQQPKVSPNVLPNVLPNILPPHVQVHPQPTRIYDTANPILQQPPHQSNPSQPSFQQIHSDIKRQEVMPPTSNIADLRREPGRSASDRRPQQIQNDLELSRSRTDLDEMKSGKLQKSSKLVKAPPPQKKPEKGKLVKKSKVQSASVEVPDTFGRSDTNIVAQDAPIIEAKYTPRTSLEGRDSAHSHDRKSQGTSKDSPEIHGSGMMSPLVVQTGEFQNTPYYANTNMMQSSYQNYLDPVPHPMPHEQGLVADMNALHFTPEPYNTVPQESTLPKVTRKPLPSITAPEEIPNHGTQQHIDPTLTDQSIAQTPTEPTEPPYTIQAEQTEKQQGLRNDSTPSAQYHDTSSQPLIRETFPDISYQIQKSNSSKSQKSVHDHVQEAFEPKTLSTSGLITSKGSAKSQRNTSGKAILVSEKDAVQWTLKTAYLAYIADEAHAKRNTPSIPQMSINDVLMSDTYGKKYPDELNDLLRKKLEMIAMKRDSMTKDDELGRLIFGKFYGTFSSPAFKTSVLKDRRLEGLILAVVSCTIKEMKDPNRPSTDLDEKSATEKYSVLFVKIVRNVMEESNLHRSNPEFMSKLNTFIQKLSNGDSSLVPSANFNQTGLIDDMKLLKITGVLFGIPRGSLQKEADRLHKEVNEQEAFTDLKIYSHNIDNIYRIYDFATDDAYESWKSKEKSLVSGLTNIMLAANPELGHLKIHYNQGEEDFQNVRFSFIPQNKQDHYRIVLRQCIKTDLKQGVVPGLEDSVVFFSKSTDTLLTELALRWRILDCVRTVELLAIIGEMYSESQIDLEKVDQALNFVKNDLQEETYGTWPISESARLSQVLRDLGKVLLREVAQILECAFEKKAESPGPVLTILEDYILKNPLYADHTGDVDEAVKLMIERLNLNATENFRAIVKNLPPLDEREILHVRQLGEDILEKGDKLKKRYKVAILKKIRIPLIAMKVQIPAFLAEAPYLCQEIIDYSITRRQTNVALEDIFDVYGQLLEMKQICLDAFTIDRDIPILEEVFSPFVFKFLQSFDDGISHIVAGVTSTEFENYPKEQVDGEERYVGTSVPDLFDALSQPLNRIRRLRWPNPQLNAIFITEYSKTVNRAIEEYCSVLRTSFDDKIAKQIGQDPTVSANNTEGGIMGSLWNLKSQVIKDDKPEDPFHLSNECCYILNDFDVLKTKVNDLANGIEIKTLATLANERNPIDQRKNSYTFKINVFEAEDLLAMDSNGFSDPYIVVKRGNNQVFKSRVIEKTLNPVWNQAFSLTSSSQGSVRLTARVWDYDTKTSSDVCGVCELELNPKRFDDYLATDIWVELQSAGDTQAQGRVHFVVTMDVDRDDLEFNFGRMERIVNQAQSDSYQIIVSKLSRMIRKILSRSTLKKLLGRTGYFNKQVAVDPTWEQVSEALQPMEDFLGLTFKSLIDFLDDTVFEAIIKQVWEEVLAALEDLLLPMLSEKPAEEGRGLDALEIKVVGMILASLREFFHHDGDGVPESLLDSPRYNVVRSIQNFYGQNNEQLMNQCHGAKENTILRLLRMRSANDIRVQKFMADKFREKRRKGGNT